MVPTAELDQANLTRSAISVPEPRYSRDEYLTAWGPLGIGWTIAAAIVLVLWKRLNAKDVECAAERRRHEQALAEAHRRHADEVRTIRDRYDERLFETLDALRDIAITAEKKITRPE